MILGTATFKVNFQTLYPDVVCGFFDLVPPNGTAGGWRSSTDSCPVIEVAFRPTTPCPVIVGCGFFDFGPLATQAHTPSAPPPPVDAAEPGVQGPNGPQVVAQGPQTVVSSTGSPPAHLLSRWLMVQNLGSKVRMVRRLS